jgi:hypothetical protein
MVVTHPLLVPRREPRRRARAAPPAPQHNHLIAHAALARQQPAAAAAPAARVACNRLAAVEHLPWAHGTGERPAKKKAQQLLRRDLVSQRRQPADSQAASASEDRDGRRAARCRPTAAAHLTQCTGVTLPRP